MAREKISGIYCIRNTVNDKRYIGQSADIHSRLSHHKAKLRRGAHPNRALQGAANKYGVDALDFKIIEECDCDQLSDRERWWIAHYETFGDKGYNFTAGGEGTRGVPHPTSGDNPKARRVLHLNTGVWYTSLSEAAKTFGMSVCNISVCCKHKTPYAGVVDGVAQVWCFEEDVAHLSSADMQELLQKGQHAYSSRYAEPRNSRSVVCLNTGKRYESIASAAAAVGISHSAIGHALKQRHSATGIDEQTQLPLVWMYADEYERIDPTEITQRLQYGQSEYGVINSDSIVRPVVCLTTGEHFRSQSEAAKKYNIDVSAICAVCAHRKRTYTVGKDPDTGLRLVWMYKDEYEAKSHDEIQEYLELRLRIKKSVRAESRKPVICTTTGITYDSVISAAETTKISATSIVRCCKGRQAYAIDQTTGQKTQWEYAPKTA